MIFKDERKKPILMETLFFLYFKKDFKSKKGYFSIILALGSIIYSFFLIDSLLKGQEVITPIILNRDLFWSGFLFIFKQFGFLISILLANNLISNDFSKNTALTLYSIIPYKKYLLWNFLFLLGHFVLLELISFALFDFMVLILFNQFLNILKLIIGFMYVLVHISFMLTFTFMVSSLTKNTIYSIMIPMVYLIIDPMLFETNLKLLSFSHYSFYISNAIQNYLYNTQFIIDLDTLLLYIIIFFSLPILWFFISIFGFQYQDIRRPL